MTAEPYAPLFLRLALLACVLGWAALYAANVRLEAGRPAGPWLNAAGGMTVAACAAVAVFFLMG